MRNLYRVLVAGVLSLPLMAVLTFLVQFVPTVTSPNDAIRLKIAFCLGAFIVGLYAVYYLENIMQRSVPIPMSDTSLEVAASAEDVFSVCITIAGSHGRILSVDREHLMCLVEIGHRRRPTLRMSINVVETNEKSVIVTIKSHSLAIFYPFDKSENAKAVLALRSSLRSTFDVPRRSRYNPENLQW